MLFFFFFFFFKQKTAYEMRISDWSSDVCSSDLVVSEKPSDPNKVYFGAWVTVEDEDGKEARYRIVGPDELDLKKNLISIDSPLARALIGKALDAEIKEIGRAHV